MFRRALSGWFSLNFHPRQHHFVQVNGRCGGIQMVHILGHTDHGLLVFGHCVLQSLRVRDTCIDPTGSTSFGQCESPSFPVCFCADAVFYTSQMESIGLWRLSDPRLIDEVEAYTPGIPRGEVLYYIFQTSAGVSTFCPYCYYHEIH